MRFRKSKIQRGGGRFRFVSSKVFRFLFWGFVTCFYVLFYSCVPNMVTQFIINLFIYNKLTYQIYTISLLFPFYTLIYLQYLKIIILLFIISYLLKAFLLTLFACFCFGCNFLCAIFNHNSKTSSKSSSNSLYFIEVLRFFIACSDPVNSLLIAFKLTKLLYFILSNRFNYARANIPNRFNLIAFFSCFLFILSTTRVINTKTIVKTLIFSGLRV